MRFGNSGYNGVHDPIKLANTIKQVCLKIKKMKKAGVKFDAIAFRGMSGAGVAYPVSAALKIPVMCVRKKESTHGRDIETKDYLDVKHYIILDDFISSGDTVRAIIHQIDKQVAYHYDEKVNCVGILLYESDSRGPFEYNNKTYKVFTSRYTRS